MNRIEKLDAQLAPVSSSLASPFLLLVRIYWGWQFHTAGAAKLHDIAKTIVAFTRFGIPAPAANAWFVAGLEFIGGLLLILGLASRPVALLLAIDMVVAYFTAHRETLQFIFSDPQKFYAAHAFTFLFASVVILIFGPGKFSVDALLASRRDPSK